MDSEVPVAKKAKLDMDEPKAYIPTQGQKDGEPNLSVIFSLKEEKGALVRALKPFEVHVIV